MKNFLSIIFLLYLSFCKLYAQEQDINGLFIKCEKHFISGDIKNAEKTLFLILSQKDSIPDYYIAAANNNLGAVYQMLGKFETAKVYYDKAELFYSQYDRESKNLADLYNNKAQVLIVQKSFDIAFEYYEKSLRIYQKLSQDDLSYYKSISASYLNIGIAYYETGEYNTALKNFYKSEQIKTKHNISGLLLVYLNMAKTFAKSGNLVKAEEYYLKSISKSLNEHGDGYLRLSEVYFDYGLFLRSTGRSDSSLEILKKALNICIKNFGEKHTLVSMSYKLIGDHYKLLSDYKNALEYYQKSIIAVVNDFNNPDVLSNPSIDSTLFDIRLLDNLKSKAQVFELLSHKEISTPEKLKILTTGIETMDLALLLVDRIRNNYPSEASKIYLAENEKESYMLATHLSCSLYDLTNEKAEGKRIYGIANKAKAAILRNEITGKKLLLSAGIPDSLLEKQKTLAGDIAAYNFLITKEMEEPNPDETKLQFWKDVLFNMNREREKISGEITLAYPLYNDLLQKTEPVSLGDLQKKLGKDETMIDYLLSNQYKDGKRLLYIFLITNDNLVFVEKSLDSLFFAKAEIIKDFNNRDGDYQVKYEKYTSALFNMYESLIMPVESFFKGRNLIIIPDEEIAWLPFDAFIKSMPAAGQTDYEGLPYLIYDYTFSYGYTSSLIFNNKTGAENVRKVFSFSPDYGLNGYQESILDPLRGAGREIESIYKFFRGQKFTGGQATEQQFAASTSDPAIFHLAMHALTDSTDSRYSYFMFDRGLDSINDGRLYNYEISLSRINSPMVVMSACNSGSGTLYQGEGLMSLARGFILAGASSVIKTAWDVNDEVSATIISSFYHNLSKGMEKDEALRKAKLEYLRVSPPSQANPYYWAAYELMGDDSPVTGNNRNVFIASGGCAILSIGFLIFYFRRRRIFSARSL